MSKVLSADNTQARRMSRSVLVLVAAIAVIGFVPWVGAEAARTTASASGAGQWTGPRQGAVLRRRRHAPGRGRQVRRPGRVPGFRELLRRGARASGNGLLTQAPPNTGAGWFTLATGAWPGVARVDQQHLPRQRPALRQPHRGVRPRRAAGRDARAGGRARRQEGGPDRVGRRAQRRDRRARRSTSATSAPAAAWPPTTSRPPTRRAFTAAFGLQFDHPDGFAGRAPFPQAAPAPATGWSRRAALLQPRAGDAPARARRRRRQVRPQRLHLRQPRRRADALRPRPVLAHQGRRRRGRRPRARASGPTSRSRSRAATSTARPARCWSRSSGSPRDLSQVRLFHTSVTRAIASWPDWPGEPGLQRRLRGLRGRALPVLAGRRLRRPRGRHRQRGDLRRAGPVLGDRPTGR